MIKTGSSTKIDCCEMIKYAVAYPIIIPIIQLVKIITNDSIIKI
jgi:hypothetical protein